MAWLIIFLILLLLLLFRLVILRQYLTFLFLFLTIFFFYNIIFLIFLNIFLFFHFFPCHYLIQTVQSHGHVFTDQRFPLLLRELSFILFDTLQYGVPIPCQHITIHGFTHHFTFTIQFSRFTVIFKQKLRFSRLGIHLDLLEKLGGLSV